MIKTRLLILCLAVAFAVSPAMAKITLPALFTNGMVLQQQTDVAIWGKSTARAITITTSWDHKKYTVAVTDTGSYWKIKVKTPAAGGPYTIHLFDGTSLTISDVLIGEVWICSGQSNMEMPVIGFGNTPVSNTNDILFNADEPQVRLFHVKNRGAATPQNDVTAKWEASTAASAATFSAVGYQFAHMLHDKLHVPIGIIESNVGGTPIQLWMDKAGVNSSPAFSKKVDTIKFFTGKESTLYNAMIAPLTGYGIKGVIWYQGESNVADYDTYDQMMKVMVQNWRDSWGIGNWGFYFVQIAPYDYRHNNPPIAYLLTPFQRETQQRALKLIPNSYMVSTADVGAEHNIHPPDKFTISKRLAMAALAVEYGKAGMPYLSPTYTSMSVKDSTAMVSFDHAENGFNSPDRNLTGFEAAGSDHVFHPANAFIWGDKIDIRCSAAGKIEAVRYCFKDYAPGNIYNGLGLPMLPFRTDDWNAPQ